MLDSQYRLVIGMNLIRRSNLKLGENVLIYYEPEERKLILKRDSLELEDKYFVAAQLLETKGRMVIPFSIRNAFPEATYLPVEKYGVISILIIEHEKKPE